MRLWRTGTLALLGVGNGTAAAENRAVPQKTENRNVIWSSDSTSAFYVQKNWNPKYQKVTNCTPMFIAALTHNNQKVEATRVQWWLHKQSIYTIWHYSAPPQRRKFMTHAVQHRYLVHYAKSNKPVTKGQILYDSTSCEVSRAVKLMTRESRRVGAGGWGAKGMGV